MEGQSYNFSHADHLNLTGRQLVLEVYLGIMKIILSLRERSRVDTITKVLKRVWQKMKRAEGNAIIEADIGAGEILEE